MRKRCGDITSVCLDVLQRVSKSTICSRILGCAKRALFSSSGAISCSYPSFGVSVQTFFIYLFLHNTWRWLVPFCIFLTRYSCLLVIRSESYRVKRGVGGVFQPSLPETLIDLQFCCCFFLQLSLLMLTFRRFYTKIHVFLFGFFSHPAQISSPAFPSLFSSPPPPYISLTAVVAGSA